MSYLIFELQLPLLIFERRSGERSPAPLPKLPLEKCSLADSLDCDSSDSRFNSKFSISSDAAAAAAGATVHFPFVEASNISIRKCLFCKKEEPSDVIINGKCDKCWTRLICFINKQKKGLWCRVYPHDRLPVDHNCNIFAFFEIEIVSSPTTCVHERKDRYNEPILRKPKSI